MMAALFQERLTPRGGCCILGKGRSPDLSHDFWHSIASMVSGLRLFWQLVIVKPALLKIRSTSADIPGILRISRAMIDSVGYSEQCTHHSHGLDLPIVGREVHSANSSLFLELTRLCFQLVRADSICP